MTRQLGRVRESRHDLRIGVAAQMYELPRHTGHGRVWTETLPRLGRLADVVVDDPAPSVWIMNGHNGDPDVRGPVVMVVYEVNWGTPEFDKDHAPGFVDWIAPATEEAVRRADHIVTGATSSKLQIIDAYGVPADRIHVVPFGVDLNVFHPQRKSAGSALLRERTGETRPYVLFAASLHPRKNLRSVRAAVTGLARRGFPHVLVVVAAPASDRQDSSDLDLEAFAELPGYPGRLVRFVRGHGDRCCCHRVKPWISPRGRQAGWAGCRPNRHGG